MRRNLIDLSYEYGQKFYNWITKYSTIGGAAADFIL